MFRRVPAKFKLHPKIKVKQERNQDLNYEMGMEGRGGSNRERGGGD